MAEDVYQFKLRIERQLFDRLAKLAARCGHSSANEFAVEALEQYAELFAELLLEQRGEMKLTRERQRQRLLNQAREGESLNQSPRRNK